MSGPTARCSTAQSIPLDFNWNYDHSALSEMPDQVPAEPDPEQAAELQLLSECLRDGLQGTDTCPTIDAMVHYLHLLHSFGIRYATVGIFPGRSGCLSDTMKGVLARMRDELPDLTPSVLSLCTDDSLAWTRECQEIHPALQSVVFMGSAPSRRLVQSWELSFIVDRLGTYIERTVALGIPVVAGTEHTTQTSPEDLRAITEAQVQGGAFSVGIADTIGIIRPVGAYRITRFLRQELDRLGKPEVLIDWHGHRDTGNALGNVFAAASAGANRVHVVSRGVGERSGNTALEEVVLNLAAILSEGSRPVPWDMTGLLELVTCYQQMVGVAAPEHGVLGRRYNHTTSGIHTDAMLKAHAMADRARDAGDPELADRLLMMARTVYSAVDPAAVGGGMSVGVSPWSGRSTVVLAHRADGRDPSQLTPELIERVLARASEVGRELTTTERARCYDRRAVAQVA
jgi:isopropylmalate/homocitrate/citramalate synthase